MRKRKDFQSVPFLIATAFGVLFTSTAFYLWEPLGLMVGLATTVFLMAIAYVGSAD